MRVLITGIEGFVGRHLARELSGAGHSVYGLYYDPGDIAEVGDIASGLYRGDVRDGAGFAEILNNTGPDAVIHLAAMSFVPVATAKPLSAWNINLGGTLNLLEWIRKYAPQAELLFVSTSEVYGRPAEGDLPYTEATPLRPENMYAATKASADLAVDRYRALYGIPAVIIRPSNHIGPGQSEDFVASSFARQAAEAALGLSDGIIRVGNLSARRDFLDVRDVVRGYRIALENGLSGIFNLGAGRGIEIRGILDKLVEISGADIDVEVDPERLRPVDVPLVEVSHGKFEEKTGWRPEIPLEKSLTDTFEWWKEKLQKQ